MGCRRKGIGGASGTPAEVLESNYEIGASREGSLGAGLSLALREIRGGAASADASRAQRARGRVVSSGLALARGPRTMVT